MTKFEEAVQAAIHRSYILTSQVKILHLSNGITEFDPLHGDIEYANSSSAAGRYFVRDNINGRHLLEDLSCDVDMSSRKLYRGIIQPGIRIGFTREMWRMSNNSSMVKPALWDLYWHFQSPDSGYATTPISDNYAQLLRTELSKYCDLLFMKNSAWISEWCELIQLTDFKIDWL